VLAYFHASATPTYSHTRDIRKERHYTRVKIVMSGPLSRQRASSHGRSTLADQGRRTWEKNEEKTSAPILKVDARPRLRAVAEGAQYIL
jgi:hypothetical protein